MPMVLERTTQKLQERPVTHTPFASSGAEKSSDAYLYAVGEKALQEWKAGGQQEYSLADLETMLATGFPANV